MKVGSFEITEQRHIEFKKEIEVLLSEMSHLTLKNFLHKEVIARRLEEYIEKRIAAAFHEADYGHHPGPEKSKPNLTPRQLKTNKAGISVQIINGSIVEIGKKE